MMNNQRSTLATSCIFLQNTIATVDMGDWLGKIVCMDQDKEAHFVQVEKIIIDMINFTCEPPEGY